MAYSVFTNKLSIELADVFEEYTILQVKVECRHCRLTLTFGRFLLEDRTLDIRFTSKVLMG